MRPIQIFQVVPALPPPLEPLRALAMNLRWAWDETTVDLFRRLDGEQRWLECGRNPVRLVMTMEQSRLEEAARDEQYVDDVNRRAEELAAYMAEQDTWFHQAHGDVDAPLVAYFSMEFGVAEPLRIFSGGLGMLAGDHLKSASDLGIPLVGVGLLYQEGYFEQRLNDAGWQHEVPALNDFGTLPLVLERDKNGEPATVELGFPEGPIIAQVWRAQVGRVPLYLLDANVAANTPDQRRVTHQLYGGAEETRIRQEILLGIGGLRILEALGRDPTVCHMNEGHAAFLGLERIRRLMDEHDATFEEAREAVAPSLVFTTHTPVEAGHDYFGPDLLERYFAVYVKSLGIDWTDFVGLGRHDPTNENELFCMTILALRLAARSNGVSRLHGEVSRAMWQGLWPGLPAHEVPIGHVTNGVHLPTWVADPVASLYDRARDERWRTAPPSRHRWDELFDLPDEELWGIHVERRHRLVEFVRHRLREQFERRGAPASVIAAAETALDPEALTIGFARRFATYKRAMLFAHDRDRLARILGGERPVQIIVAGKAHPRDDAGKELIRQIVELSREEPLRGRIVFVEDYGMAVARELVAGADVWLNNPIRPREASGTSGMKAAANGVLNLSTLDGWWDEAWRDLAGDGVSFGWAIGPADRFEPGEELDRFEAEALYEILEHDVVPTFYDRGEDGIPHGWVWRMREAIASLSPCFNTHRMLHEYAETLYLPAAGDTGVLAADSLARARLLASWRQRIVDAWPAVRCSVVPGERGDGEVRVGDEIKPRAHVELGSLGPDDVHVELYLGPVASDGDIHEGHALPMLDVEQHGDGTHVYEAVALQTSGSGRFGYTVRVRPHHDDMPERFLPHAITWADGATDDHA
ncbi:MAG: alpha-glucan family phosphorylase [Nitriliruptorales bacterium]